MEEYATKCILAESVIKMRRRSNADISPCKDKMDYVMIALAIETLAYENKNYLWTGDNCKISETIQNLLWTALTEKQYEENN